MYGSSDTSRTHAGATTREKLVAPSALLNVVLLAFLAGTVVAIWILFAQGGLDYYLTPLRVRGYDPAHQFLRPSGPGGHLLGIAGTLVMTCTLFYVVRKRVSFLSKMGTTRGWLEFHIFCGVFGPILITFHTSFKFNGIISVAYWSMVLVVVSGFIGRSLYVRIPKTIRGVELTRTEIEERAREMKAHLAESTIPAALVLRIEQVEQAVFARANEHPALLRRIQNALRTRREMAHLREEIRRSGLSRALLHEALDSVEQRAILMRRLANLKRTRELFQLWHVFHRPLVWVMFLIFSVHLGVAIYFGYTFGH